MTTFTDTDSIPDGEYIIRVSVEVGAFYHIEHDDYMEYSFVAKMLSDGWLALPTRSVGEPTKMISDGYRITKMVKEGDAIR